MSHIRRFVASTVLASCLVASATLTPAVAQVDRGVTPGGAATAPDTRRDGSRDWGWLGLLGLAGLAGLMRNPRNEHLGTKAAAAR